MENDTDYLKIKEVVDSHIDLIAFDGSALNESLERATKFLIVVAVLSDFKLNCERRKAKLTTLREAFFSHAMQNSQAKQVTEKKAEAESNKEYTNQREAVENLEAEISWARVTIDIFNNAHVTYRQLSKGEL